MLKEEIARLVRPNILRLTPYTTARDDYQGSGDSTKGNTAKSPASIRTFLDANENPFGNGWNRYPDPHQVLIRSRLAEIKGMPPANIFTANGSDEAIDLMFRIFCTPGQSNAVSIAPTYGMYSVAAAINDVEFREVPLREDFSLDADAVLQACDSGTRLVFLCSPNNPTGNALDRGEMLRIVRKAGCIVVVDEAYADFSSGGSLRSAVGEYSNLVVLQTLSKAWGMAALRLGIAYADSGIISLMERVKYPYNISRASQDAVMELLGQGVQTAGDDFRTGMEESDPAVERMRREVGMIIRQRDKLSGALGEMGFVQKVWPSDANFLLVKVNDADRLYGFLIGKNIIVRNRTRVSGCEGCLRITVGTAEENDALLKALDKFKDTSNQSE